MTVSGVLIILADDGTASERPTGTIGRSGSMTEAIHQAPSATSCAQRCTHNVATFCEQIGSTNA